MVNYSYTLVKELKSTLVERCKTNPRYSMRAFAQSLEVSPAYLSQILSGKRRVALEMAKKMTEAISNDRLLKERVIKEVTGQRTDDHELHYKNMEVSMFDQISEWYFYSILSLIETSDFQPDTRWIATRLGISYNLVQDAIEKLIQMELLDTSGTKWVQKVPPIKVDTKKPSAGTRKYQNGVINKALNSLENDPYEVRDITSCTMAISPELIDGARKKVAEFRRKLMRELEMLSHGRQTEVYNLNIQLFPTTKVRKK